MENSCFSSFIKNVERVFEISTLLMRSNCICAVLKKYLWYKTLDASVNYYFSMNSWRKCYTKKLHFVTNSKDFMFSIMFSIEWKAKLRGRLNFFSYSCRFEILIRVRWRCIIISFFF